MAGNQDREWQFLNRTYLAQVDSIDHVAGTADIVILDNLCTRRETLELPRLGFDMNGHQSSWMRYMPQIANQTIQNGNLIGGGGPLVNVAFGPHNEARIVSYATQPGMYKGYADQRTTNPKNVPRGDWVDLQGGEWDFRSSGGAYIFGQASGALLFSAGPRVKILLDKSNVETRAESGLWAVASVGSYIRLGDIKRKVLPSDFKETNLSLIPLPIDVASKEYWLHVETPPSTTQPLSTLIADHNFGACRDSAGIPFLGPTGAPLRYRRKIWDIGILAGDPVPTAAYSNEIDSLGNQTVQFGLAATTVSVTALDPALTNATVEFNTITATATTSTAISSAGTASLTAGTVASVESAGTAFIDAATIVSLGTPALALNPSVHGASLELILAGILTPLAALATTMAGIETPATPKGAAWTAFGVSLTATIALLAIPPGTPAALLSDKVFVE